MWDMGNAPPRDVAVYVRGQPRARSRRFGARLRRNTVHVVVLVPEHNMKSQTHFVYRYPPQGICVNLLLKRISKEIYGVIKDQLKTCPLAYEKFFFCQCARKKPPPPLQCSWLAKYYTEDLDDLVFSRDFD